MLTTSVGSAAVTRKRSPFGLGPLFARGLSICGFLPRIKGRAGATRRMRMLHLLCRFGSSPTRYANGVLAACTDGGDVVLDSPTVALPSSESPVPVRRAGKDLACVVSPLGECLQLVGQRDVGGDVLRVGDVHGERLTAQHDDAFVVEVPCV